MSERMILNRIRKLMELEEQMKSLQQQADKLKEEIKADMEAKKQVEMKVGNHVVRFKTVLTNRLDSKSLQSSLPDVYKQFVKQTESRRFTVA